MTDRRTQGFTLVEMTIAIAFLSVLMMAILTISMSAGKLYIKGDTNKSINQAGRDFADTIRRDFLATGVGSITSVPPINGGSAADPQYSGRICVGSVAYLWNTAGLLNVDSPAPGSLITMGASSKPVKLVRVSRTSQLYCQPNGSGRYPTVIDSSDVATELFAGTGREYALYDMTIQQIAADGEKGMYRISYTLGTNEPGATERDAAGFVRCKTDNAQAANFSYCSVSEFEMLVRVGGVEQP